MNTNGGDNADNETTMLEKINNKNSNNKRKWHQQMTFALSNCDSNNGNEMTKVGNSESESKGETTTTTVVKKSCDREGGKGVVRNTNWKKNENLRSGLQTTRCLMREFAKTHVFKEMNLWTMAKGKRQQCFQIDQDGIEK